MSKTPNPAFEEESTKGAAPEEPVSAAQPAPEKTEEPQESNSVLAAAEAELAEAKNQYLRLLAEYDNYRKRTLKEKESIYAEAKAGAVTTLLPVYDNLCRAFAAETADEAYRKGVEMTLSQCVAAFEKLGATRIQAQGAPFDPTYHNAVMHVKDDSVGEGVVVEVFQDGFLLGEKVIRTAMVKVAN
ncbi:MAG TPA: nucleotide exchange factor GrpE [Oscillospiraceae bacterium]|nr:nucleotide exchange factor GrpE [Oscillospiraceae bacterium]